MRRALAIVAAIALVGVAASVGAQQAALFSRTEVQRGDLSTPGHEVVTVIADMKPGGTPGWHTHPGEEVTYVLQGTVTISQAGKPDQTVAAGKAFIIPAGTVHNATNTGKADVKLLVNYIVEKGKPLATPTAAPAGKK